MLLFQDSRYSSIHTSILTRLTKVIFVPVFKFSPNDALNPHHLFSIATVNRYPRQTMIRVGRHRVALVLGLVVSTTLLIWYLCIVPADVGEIKAIHAIETALKTLDSNPNASPAINPAAAEANHMVMVPGHAIWKGGSTQGQAPSEW